MEGFQSVKYFVGQLHDAIVKLIPTKTSQLENDSGFVTSANTYDVFSTNENGLVPAPQVSETDRFLAADGTWKAISDGSDVKLHIDFDTMELVQDVTTSKYTLSLDDNKNLIYEVSGE